MLLGEKWRNAASCPCTAAGRDNRSRRQVRPHITTAFPGPRDPRYSGIGRKQQEDCDTCRCPIPIPALHRRVKTRPTHRRKGPAPGCGQPEPSIFAARRAAGADSRRPANAGTAQPRAAPWMCPRSPGRCWARTLWGHQPPSPSPQHLLLGRGHCFRHNGNSRHREPDTRRHRPVPASEGMQSPHGWKR